METTPFMLSRSIVLSIVRHGQTSLACLLVGGRVRTNKVVGGGGGSSQAGECLLTRTLDKFLLCLGDW